MSLSAQYICWFGDTPVVGRLQHRGVLSCVCPGELFCAFFVESGSMDLLKPVWYIIQYKYTSLYGLYLQIERKNILLESVVKADYKNANVLFHTGNNGIILLCIQVILPDLYQSRLCGDKDCAPAHSCSSIKLHPLCQSLVTLLLKVRVSHFLAVNLLYCFVLVLKDS